MHRFLSPLACGLIFTLSLLPTHSSSNGQEEPRAVELEPGLQVETRGPVHEAFAQPFELTPEPGPLVPKQPPPPVPEEAPEQRPEGDNVQWIPGYWAWDADRNEFLWISGVMRNAPAGRQYVPGYWVQEGDGWRWVQGFWASAEQTQVPYVPAPPASLENGPSVPPPDDNYFYAPGSWVWREPGWAWRPGFWSPCRPGRVWIAAHHVWTPAGCVYVDGYWDYPLEDRGLLFAPVCFHEPLWRRPDWCYRPSVVLRIGSLFDCFFVRHRSYHFGDYYGDRCAGLGYRPWFAASRFDPHFHYARWHHRHNRGWADGLRQVHADRSAGRAPRPPRTFVAQGGNGRAASGPFLATALSNVNTVKLRPAVTAERQTFVKSTQRQRELAQTRSNLETTLAAKGERSPRGPGRALELRNGTPGPIAPAASAPRKESAATVNANPPKIGPLDGLSSKGTGPKGTAPTGPSPKGTSPTKPNTNPIVSLPPAKNGAKPAASGNLPTTSTNQGPASGNLGSKGGPSRNANPPGPSQGSPRIGNDSLPRGPRNIEPKQASPAAPSPGSALPPVNPGNKAGSRGIAPSAPSAPSPPPAANSPLRPSGAGKKSAGPSNSAGAPSSGKNAASRSRDSGLAPSVPTPPAPRPEPPRSVAPKTGGAPKVSSPSKPPPSAAPSPPRMQAPAAQPRFSSPPPSSSRPSGSGPSVSPRSSSPSSPPAARSSPPRNSSPPAARSSPPRNSGPAQGGGGGNKGGNNRGGGNGKKR